MIRGFFSSLGLLIILNAIVKPIWIFGIDRQVQNLVGTEEYGQYFSILGLSIVFSFLLDWGFTTFFNRQMAANPAVVLKQTGSFLLLKAGLLIIYGVTIFLIAGLTGIGDSTLVIQVILIQILASLFIFFRSVITALQLFKTDAWISVLDKSMVIILCGSMIYFPSQFIPVTINNFLWIQVACLVLAVICAVLVALRNKVNYSLRHHIISINLIKQAAPYALIVLLMSAHYRADGFLLSELHQNGFYEAGVYASGYRVLDAANMVGYLVASFLVPFIAANSRKKEAVANTVRITRNFLLGYAIIAGLAFLFFASPIYLFLYRDVTPQGPEVLSLCMASLIGYCLVHIYGSYLTAIGKVKEFCWIVLIFLILNLALNFILIPRWGALGSSIAAIISHSLSGLTVMLYAHMRYIYTSKKLQHA